MTQPAVQNTSCPKCGKPGQQLVDVDVGLKLFLKEQGHAGAVPQQVCNSCYTDLSGQVSQGVKLRMEQQNKEKHRNLMWKSRVNLVKQARSMMQVKSYSDAAINYEKYIRVLEIVYDLKPGELNPSVFGKSTRSKELTIVATTYWDLFRIYDTNPKYRDRMAKAGKKLAEFLPFSAVKPDIVKKAAIFVNTAKNPDIVRTFIKDTGESVATCFIATAAFEDGNHPVVQDFRIYRDTVLVKTVLGRVFIRLYYMVSPTLAAVLNKSKFLKPRVRAILRFIHRRINI